MSGHLIFPGGLVPSHYKSATTQEGAHLSPIIKGAGNVGALSLALSGSPTADIDLVASIETAGNIKTATYTASIDGGSTTLGRKVDTTWDGNGATDRTILADTGAIYCSAPVAIDSDGDGIADKVLVAITRASTTPDQIDIMQTTDLTGAGAWTTLSNVAASGVQGANPALVVHGSNLFLFSTAAPDTVSLYGFKSTDYGATWGSAITIDTTLGVGAYGVSAINLLSGKIMVAYAKLDSSYAHIYCKTSADGVTWTATAKKVTAAGSVNYAAPSVIQETDGKTVVFFERDTATAAIQARQTTAADPASSSATWATYSETLWSGGTTDAWPSAAIAPDGTIYVVFAESTGEFKFSKFKDGDANFSADATAYNPAWDCGQCALGMIGGALWVVVCDDTNYDAKLVLTRYWTTWNATTAPASWTGTAPQFLSSGVWATWGGASGESGDTYSSDTTYTYGADRMVALRPSHPTRSTADNADWNCVFDLGANVLVPVDTVCVYANVEHLHFQMNASDSWGSPSVNTTVSFVRETIAAYTAANGKVTRSSGTWRPHELAGLHGRFNTSGTVYLIRDNDATSVYIDAAIGAEAGDFKILSPRAWATQTAGSYRYIRILIESQDTVAGYYQVGALAVGVRHALATYHKARTTWGVPLQDTRLISGGIIRSDYGDPRRSWSLNIIKPTAAEYAELAAGIRNRGASPMAYIPDTSIAYDWALVHPQTAVEWAPDRTVVAIEEVV